MADNQARNQPPLSAEEVGQVVLSAMRYELNAPPLSDLGLARILVAALDGNARYDHAAGCWLVWNGRVWQRDNDGAIMRFAKAAADKLAADAELITDSDARKQARRAAKNGASVRSLKAMIELASSEPGVSIDGDSLDADPWVFNASTGIVDLRDGGLRPHDRGAYQSKLIPFAYSADAVAPRWLRFIDEVTCGDADLAGFLQRFVGYCLTGDTTAQVFLILLGRGANGKSLFLNTLSYVFGDYAHTAPGSLLLEKSAGAASNDLVSLRGSRLVTLSEAPEGAAVDTARLKSLTGSEPITARALFREFVTFQPVAKFVWALNNLPRWDTNDGALWRRTKVAPFLRTFEPHEQDPNLAAVLRGEAEGILRWCVEGCLAWQRDGLGTCAAVESATAEARADGDEIGAFLADHCTEDAKAAEDAGGLYSRYQSFAFANGLHAASPTAFGRSMTRRGFRAGKLAGRRVRHGLRLQGTGVGR